MTHAFLFFPLALFLFVRMFCELPIRFVLCGEQALKELRAKASQKGSFGGAGLKKSGKK